MSMELQYIPGGRWVRLLGADDRTVVPLGRWHLAATAMPVPDRTTLVALACGRELRSGRGRGAEIASMAGRPHANVCPICQRTWVREESLPARDAAPTGIDALA